ncbi:hypothetical protein DKX38_004662 [Salix brachista]|uniref:Uncharacterized protein n=1 Tax=Salix brachista TaxID=2182728 RepID=A0A5N5NC43_9ROSI|nr:hypothetical protein DKX38_004662 [Salix brachista]
MGGTQAWKRIPRIKFPQRHPTKSSGSRVFYLSLISPYCNGSQPEEALSSGSAYQAFFYSLKASTSVGGKASLQPKRTPVSNEEIEAILIASLVQVHGEALKLKFVAMRQVVNKLS